MIPVFHLSLSTCRDSTHWDEHAGNSIPKLNGRKEVWICLTHNSEHPDLRAKWCFSPMSRMDEN
jgi:hypothetical protein